MLEHFFWLLEFKSKFEFYCLKPHFKKMLNPFSFFLYPFPPSSPTQPAAAPASQPATQLASSRPQPP
jgi:hypothetical protein